MLCLTTNFSYQALVCNRFHAILQKYRGFNDVTIITVKENVYRIDLGGMNKKQVVSKMKNGDLNEKSRHL